MRGETMQWGLVLAVAVVWIGNARAAPEEGVGARYLMACSAELGSRNFPADAADCEKLLVLSHQIQSDAIRYLAQADDKERQVFGAASTLVRYEIVEPDVDPAALVSLLLNEKETAAPGMVVQLAKDVMKSGCGYYQIDVIMKALAGADALPPPPKQVSRKSARAAYKSCIGEKLHDGKVADCLNPIFYPVMKEPSPSP